MGLYNSSVMAAILDIQNCQTQAGQSTKDGSEKNRENQMNIDCWRAFT